MPWDYVNVIAPVIAIINSVIAASISHFRPEKYHLKVVILAASIVLGLIAAAATVYGQYSSVQERRAEIARQNEIRNHLGSLISREDGLLALLRDPSQPFPATSGNAWASEAETYLKESLGAGYVDRFRDSSGMLHGSPVGLDTERLGYWNGIYERVARLQQFSGEVSH